ncbi:MAG: alpha/beta hydrolase [Hyphomicrobiaceae bacterium]|nr:alpha/beta hydrolase [Hyphomicrobiaceae bacterium]
MRQPAFVLVHGAWHGGWCWRRVVDLLTKAGHQAFAPTLTGLGERSHLARAGLDLTTHITDIVNVLKWERLDNVVLAGHSYGGFVISGVAERMAPALASLVFVDAFVPEHGDTLAKAASATTRRLVEEAVERGDTTLAPIPAAVFQVNEKDRAWVDALCVAHPLATLVDQIELTGARERVAKKVYVRAKGYASPSFDAALAKVQALPSWRTFELPCGHDVMVDRPERLAEILLDSARGP